mmetsp:Transcript_35991/g.72208  ORF Transcript_35991/g.72208 Transcript_35991/m.72208 type:complete len:248 (-) Transcript_35991:119-862(-)
MMQVSRRRHVCLALAAILCVLAQQGEAYITRQMSTMNNNKMSYFAPRSPTVLRTASVRKRQSAKRTLSRTASQMLSQPKKLEMVEGSIEVNAPAAAVYKVASDFEKFPEWASGVKRVFVEKKGQKPPEVVKLDMAMFGMHHLNTMKYEYDPGRHMSWTMTDGGVKALNGNYDFTPLPNGHTKVTFQLSVDPGFPVPHMLKKMTEKAVVASAVKGLKAYTEEHLHDSAPAPRRPFLPAFAVTAASIAM